jgi:uncharacterized protein (TIGR03086 family)
MQIMNQQELFILANQTLQTVINQIKPEQMDLIIPDEMSWRPNQTVRAAMNIYAYENACVPDVLAGKEKFPTNDEFKDDLLKDDPQVNYAKYSDAANDATRNLDDPERIVHISYGDFPAYQYLSDITIQRGLGAYDLAKFIHADTKLPDDLVQGLWTIIEPIAEQLREYGVFRAKVDVPENEPLQDRLLGLTGRNPPPSS